MRADDSLSSRVDLFSITSGWGDGEESSSGHITGDSQVQDFSFPVLCSAESYRDGIETPISAEFPGVETDERLMHLKASPLPLKADREDVVPLFQAFRHGIRKVSWP